MKKQKRKSGYYLAKRKGSKQKLEVFRHPSGLYEVCKTGRLFLESDFSHISKTPIK